MSILLDNLGVSIFLAGAYSDPVRAVEGVKNIGLTIIELVVPGTGMGASSQVSFDNIRNKQCSALAEQQPAGKLQIQVHIPPSIEGLAGLNAQGVLSDESVAETLREWKRTLMFMERIRADGPMTIHLGEYRRPFMSLPARIRPLFQDYTGADDVAPFIVVDRLSKHSVASYLPQDLLELTIAAKDEYGRALFLTDADGNLFVTDQGHLLPQPEFRNGIVATRSILFRDFCHELNAEDPNVGPDEAALKVFELHQTKRINLDAASAREISIRHRDTGKELQRLIPAKKMYTIWAGGLSAEERYQVQRHRSHPLSARSILVAGEMEDIPTVIQQEYLEALRRYEMAEEQIRALRERIAQANRQTPKLQTLRGAVLERSTSTIAALAMLCHKARRGSVSVENVNPLMYGSAAEEIIYLVLESRKVFTKLLAKKHGYSRAKASATAQRLIGATYDLQHANMWFRYFVGGSRKDFDEFLVSELQMLLRASVVNKIHLSDSNGFQDSHLPVGQGNLPWRRLLGVLASEGYTGPVILETQINGDYLAGARESLQQMGLLPDVADSMMIMEDPHLMSRLGFPPGTIDESDWSGIPLH